MVETDGVRPVEMENILCGKYTFLHHSCCHAPSFCLLTGFPAKAFPAPLQVHERLDKSAGVDDEVACPVELRHVDESWDHLVEDKVDAPHQVAQAEGYQDCRDEVDGSGLHAAVPLASPLPWSWLPQGRKDAHVAEEHHRHEGDAPDRQDPQTCVTGNRPRGRKKKKTQDKQRFIPAELCNKIVR